MKPAHCGIVRACSPVARRSAAVMIGMALVWMAIAPCAAWGQWTGGPTGPIYYSGGNVGIGTTAPVVPLDVKVSPGFHFGAFVNTAGAVSIGGFNDGFTAWRPLSINAGGQVWLLGGNVGIGTTNPQYKLAVNGTIGAKEVIVTNTGWSDYVFRPGYRLRPLSELGAYIRAHHHLPGIPSEADVQEKGVSVGDMQARLLAKVEELTLHLIRQDEENRELRERIAKLENRSAGR